MSLCAAGASHSVPSGYVAPSGPLIFIVLIDDLRLTVLTHKFLDDTTVSEIVIKDTASEMQHTVDVLTEWSEVNHMTVNSKKTKEMVLGPLSKESTTPLLMTCNLVQQVTCINYWA